MEAGLAGRPGVGRGGYDVKNTALLLALVAVVAWQWNSPLIYPIQVFTVFLHELSHGLAAVLTGGSIERIELSANLGGVCWHRGGWAVVVLPAGYLGSLLWGALILVGAARTRHDRAIAIGLGVLMLFVALLFVRPLLSFGFGFCLLFGVGLVALGRYGSDALCDPLLRLLGLTSCLYAVFDIKDDLIVRTVKISDAYRMSEIIPLPARLWGVIWIVIALAGAGLALHFAASGGEDESGDAPAPAGPPPFPFPPAPPAG